MFPSVSSIHVHPEFVLIPPEAHWPEPPRSSTPVSIHVPVEDSRPGAGNASLHLMLPAGYISLPSGKLHPDLMHPGLQIDEAGRRFISDGEHMYAVRFDPDHQTERVYQPGDPVKPGIPVRFNGADEYERHSEVGLKGGSPGRELQTALTAAKESRDRCRLAEQDARRVLDTVESEVRRSSKPNDDLQLRLQLARQVLNQRGADFRGAEDRLHGLLRQAQQLRQKTQDELSRARTLRHDGLLAESHVQLEINLLGVTPYSPGISVADLQDKLRQRRDELRQIQNGNAHLDRSIATLQQDLNEVPYL